MGRHLDTTAGRTSAFGDLADALGLGIAYEAHVSADGRTRRFTYLSRSWRELTGFPAERALGDSSLLYDLIYPEDRPTLERAEAEATKARRRFKIEVRFQIPHLGVRWARITSIPQVLGDGSTVWEGLIEDITQGKRAQLQLQEKGMRLQVAAEATGLGLWEWAPIEGRLIWSERTRELFGVGPHDAIDIQRFLQLVHPDDRESVLAAWEAFNSAPERGDLVIQYRTAQERDGAPRWLESRGRLVGNGGVRLIVGTTLDISERKAADEQRALRMGELAHRFKNGILIVMAIVRQTAQGVVSVAEFEDLLMSRLQALADSQDLVTASGGWPVSLADLVATTLRPFDLARFDLDEALAAVTISDELAVTLSLLLHELATNAVKYGALSASGGRVRIGRQPDERGQVVLEWVERGGPPVRVGARKGFGSRLLQISLRREGGGVEPVFAIAGFEARIRFPFASSPARRPC